MWRDQYQVHPAADVFPMMTDDALANLGEDIKANGLNIPIQPINQYPWIRVLEQPVKNSVRIKNNHIEFPILIFTSGSSIRANNT